MLVVLAPLPARAEAHSRTHVVYSGQRLGSIAKRYNVTVAALARANGIKESSTIRPGQRLVIPQPGDRGEAPAPSSAKNAPAPKQKTRTVIHRVEQGHRLELIAKRYGVSVDAICNANRIQRRSVIRPGQTLTIPGTTARGTEISASEALQTGYRAYFRKPRVKGHIELVGYTQRFRGHVFDRKGKLLPLARAGISRVLNATGARPDPDHRLIKLLVNVSDRFGGRALRIVSGYRTTSFFEDSRHKESRAVDFSIPGVPNEALRDYLRTLPNVGVGYYPNSSFVHVDVREYAAYWVDYSGPGEAPRSRAIARRGAPETHEHGHAAEPRAGMEARHERATLPATGTAAAFEALSELMREASGARKNTLDTSPAALPPARPSAATP
jgi:LysM repeat protein